MSDRLMTDGSRKGMSNLRTAYDRARVLKDHSRKPEPYVLGNIKRHQHKPVLAPKGPLRYAPDAQAFRYHEAMDRKDALDRRRSDHDRLQRELKGHSHDLSR